MELNNPPEPIKIKKEAKLFHQRHSSMKNYDSFYIWLKENLASYLWSKCKWGKILKNEGISWREIEKIISMANFKRWVRDERDWNEQLDAVKELINNRNLIFK